MDLLKQDVNQEQLQSMSADQLDELIEASVARFKELSPREGEHYERRSPENRALNQISEIARWARAARKQYEDDLAAGSEDCEYVYDLTLSAEACAELRWWQESENENDDDLCDEELRVLWEHDVKAEGELGWLIEAFDENSGHPRCCYYVLLRDIGNHIKGNDMGVLMVKTSRESEADEYHEYRMIVE